MNALFQESQNFRGTPAVRWIVGSVVVTDVIVAVLIFALTRPENYNQAGFWIAQVTLFVVTIGIIAMFAVTRIDTRVTQDDVSVRMWPLKGRTISAAGIREVRIVDVYPMEYGGWGVRWISRGRAYIYRGGKGKGVRLDLQSGMHVLIESDRPDELLEAINEIRGAVA